MVALSTESYDEKALGVGRLSIRTKRKSIELPLDFLSPQNPNYLSFPISNRILAAGELEDMAKKSSKPKQGGVQQSILRVAARLYPESSEHQQRFIEKLAEPSNRSAFIWLGQAQPPAEFLTSTHQEGSLPSPLFEAPTDAPIGRSQEYQDGLLYPVDFSSAVLASALQVAQGSRNVLDLCASPGGKSVAAAALVKPETLISNEVIGKRLGALVGNLKRCHLRNAAVTSRDPEWFRQEFRDRFDLVIADAPCSGQSLQRKGHLQAGAFMKHMVAMNAKRQRRIVAAAAQCVAPGGYLAYLTCTFSREENEEVIERLLEDRNEFAPVEVPHLERYRSWTFGGLPAYRVMPEHDAGAGGFVCVLKRSGTDETSTDLEFDELPTVWRGDRMAPGEE